eukprot:4090160-Karenia_brevis.AAC.1
MFWMISRSNKEHPRDVNTLLENFKKSGTYGPGRDLVERREGRSRSKSRSSSKQSGRLRSPTHRG